MSPKAQVSMEFLILISFLFVLSIGFFIVAAAQMDSFSGARRSVILSDFAESLQRELVLASGVKDGYAREVELPDRIEGSYEYGIVMGNLTLTVEMGEEVAVLAIPEVQGTLEKGKNTIRKANGSVVIANG